MWRHSADEDADLDADLALAINLKGSAVISLRGRDLVLREQDAMLGSRIEIDRMIQANPNRFRILVIPRAATSPRLAGVESAVAGPIPRDSPRLQALVRYLGAIEEKEVHDDVGLASAVAAHIRDLVGLIIHPTRDASGPAKNHGARAARLRALKVDILANLVGGKLSLDQVAARQGISASYVRKLFESDGTSFTEFVLAQRLLQAHRMLINPRFADQSIGEIALSTGFHDQSYFNRTFRRRFGRTPSKLRLAVLRKDG